MKRIRLTHVIFSLEAGGMENGVVNLCNRLDPEIFDTSICTLKAGGELEARLDRDRVKLYNITRNFGNDPTVPPRIACQFWMRGVDIVHSHNWVTLVEGASSAVMARAPVLIHGQHGYPMEERSRNVKVQRFVWSKIVTQLLSVSSELGDSMAELTDLPRELIEVIPNGVDTTRFFPQTERRAELRERFDLPPDALIAGMVARLVPVKNHEGALRAIAELHAAGTPIHLALAGIGGLEESLRELAESLGITPFVHFLGYREDVHEVYHALDVFLLNSHREGMSNTIIEAMACGVPVVATNVGSNGESVVEGETGFLIPPDEVSATAEALKKFDDAELRAKFGAAARDRIEREFSINRMVERYTDLYLRTWPHPSRPQPGEWKASTAVATPSGGPGGENGSPAAAGV